MGWRQCTIWIMCSNHKNPQFAKSGPQNYINTTSFGLPEFVFFFQAEDGIRYLYVTGVQTCALPISSRGTSLPHWGSATGSFMRWPTRLEILLARAAGARPAEDVASFGSGTLSIIGSATGTLVVIIGCRVTRSFAPRLRVDGRNQAGCGYDGGRTVKPPPLRYLRPGSLAEALATLASLGEHGKVLAGGQSLVPLLSMRLAAPEHLVDINRLAELGYVRVEDGQVRVGALARHAEVLADPAAAAAQPLLAKALRFVAHAAIRNRGTTVGSIVHADPAGEMPAVLAVLDGAVRVAYQGGERLVPASEFFLGPLESAVQPGELATEALFPVLPLAAGTGFAEVSRRRGDYAVCGVAAIVRLDEDGRIAQARAAYLSVGPAPLVLDLTDAAVADQAAAGPALTKAAAAGPAAAGP